MSDAPHDTRSAAPILTPVLTAVEGGAEGGPARPKPGLRRPPLNPVPAAGQLARQPGHAPGHTPGQPRLQPASPGLKPGQKSAQNPALKPALKPVAPAARPAVRVADAAARPARFRFRHIVLATSLFLCVLLPFATTVWYLYTRAADEYHSETAFSVRSAEIGASAAAGLLGALTMVGGGSASDTDILFDYIRSQEMVEAIDAKLDLRTIYNRAGPRDFVFSLGKAPTIEQMTAYWRRMVEVDLDTLGGIIHVRANAFTPADATAIATAILAESSALVNRLSTQARDDAVNFAQDELAETQENLKTQRARIADFRRQNQLVDPGADVAGQMGLLGALQAELAKAMVERDQLLSFVSKDDQRVVQADRRIDAIDKRISAERGTLGAEGPGTTLTDVVGTYEELRVDLEFAQATYTQSLAAVTAARAEARRQSRYLAPHVTPTTAEESLYPRRALLSGLALLFLTIGWSIVMLIYYNVRDTSR